MELAEFERWTSGFVIGDVTTVQLMQDIDAGRDIYHLYSVKFSW